MPAVIPLVIAGVSAASSAYAAKTQANAARDAANTQAAAGNQALGVQQQMWNQQLARQQPYVDMGAQALARADNQARMPRPQMPMFNPNAPMGGWTPQNYAAQAPNPYQKMYQQGNQNMDPFAGGRQF